MGWCKWGRGGRGGKGESRPSPAAVISVVFFSGPLAATSGGWRSFGAFAARFASRCALSASLLRFTTVWQSSACGPAFKFTYVITFTFTPALTLIHTRTDAPR